MTENEMGGIGPPFDSHGLGPEDYVPRPAKDRRIEPPFVVIQGYIREAGGGTITVVIERDTPSYPPVGIEVALVVVNRERWEQ